MKLNVTITIELTPEQAASYVTEYGLPDGKAATVKADVLDQVESAIYNELWTATVRRPARV